MKKSSQKVARDARSKALKFNAAKKDTLKELASLRTAAATAQAKLIQKATETSLVVAKFGKLSGDVYVATGESEVQDNPKLQNDIDFDSIFTLIDSVIDGVKEAIPK